MDQQYDHFMFEVIDLSIKNVKSGKGGPFAALIVKDGRIIARGTNMVTSVNDPTAHAEIVAIREACKVLNSHQLVGCEMYTSCEPCPMCLGAIYWARPSKVYYGNTREDAARIGFDDALIYEELARAMGKRKIPMMQCMREEAAEAFRIWQEKIDKVMY